MDIKQKAIQEAYGEYWEQVKDYVDENGWCEMYNSENKKVSPNFYDLGFSRDYVSKNIDSGYNSKKNNHEWRPKSLEGIENNRSWIKIESELDLPKESGYYHLMVLDDMRIDFFNLQNKKFDLFALNSITHYRVIEKPKKPIY